MPSAPSASSPSASCGTVPSIIRVWPRFTVALNFIQFGFRGSTSWSPMGIRCPARISVWRIGGTPVSLWMQALSALTDAKLFKLISKHCLAHLRLTMGGSSDGRGFLAAGRARTLAFGEAPNELPASRPPSASSSSRRDRCTSSLTERAGLLLHRPARLPVRSELLELVLLLERLLVLLLELLPSSASESAAASESSISALASESTASESSSNSPLWSSGMLVSDLDDESTSPGIRCELCRRTTAGRRCDRLRPDLRRARSSSVSTGCGFATSHNTLTPWSEPRSAACIRMPIMHSFGFSWSAESRKHWEAMSWLEPGRRRCRMRPRSKPLKVTSLNASFRETTSSGLMICRSGWWFCSWHPKTFSSPHALSTRYSCVSTSRVASKTM
mmetsp:Transcript_44429/g.115562  ORF Transcript_44429/g.115562 Transcript_44429/m.115562 type:complete len:388 (+) Transcript_44429:158-1321(+)